MNIKITVCRLWLSMLLAYSIGTGGLVTMQARTIDRKPVVITFGQPNIWSLEQAHYLLGRLHSQNLDLKAKDIGPDDLNPNAVNGNRITILKSLLEVNAQFDQSMRFQNERLVKNQRFNQDRRFELTTKRDQLRENSLQLQQDINRLNFERAQLVSSKASEADLALKDAEIERKKEDQAAVDKEIGLDNDELKTLNAEPSGTPQTPALTDKPFDKSKLPTSILDDVVKDDVKKLLDAARDPHLDASTTLDNHIQMQYEIIAKQLTLLRDEVGPGERLVFLELPQSIYTTPGGGDEKMAQSWWHINGYTKTDALIRRLLELYEIEAKWLRILSVPAFLRIAKTDKWPMPPCLAKSDQAPQTPSSSQDESAVQRTKELTDVLLALRKEHDNARTAALKNLFREGDATFAMIEQRGGRNTSAVVEAVRKKISINSTGIDFDKSKAYRKDGTQQDESIKKLKDCLLRLLSNPLPDLCDPDYDLNSGVEFVRLDNELNKVADGNVRNIERRTARTVDIIPRQSSLNVNDVQETVKSTGILAAFKFLFGFAGQVNYQRQKEQYEQFLHQELFASGFGKGNRDFGWTFGAVPGTKRVAPGVRTTYAAVVLPDDAESIVLSARGCYFPRKSNQPLDYADGSKSDWGDNRLSRNNCSEEQSYILPVPGGGDSNNFWVARIDYQQVTKEGQPAVISIRGNNFSSQIGALVDGIPLRQTITIGLAQPLLAGTGADNCKDAKVVCGSMERIDAHQIVLSFVRPGNGTPVITLIAPGKSIDLNALEVLINPPSDGPDPWKKRRLDQAEPIFPAPAKTPPKEALSITELQVFRDAGDAARGFALVTGAKFMDQTRVFVNGRELGLKPLPVPQAPKGRRAPRPAPKVKEFKEFKSANLYRLEFLLPADRAVTVTLQEGDAVATKSVENPRPAKE